MTNENAKKLAGQLVDDLRGAAYYADPEILAGILPDRVGGQVKNESAAIEVLRALLRKYATKYATVEEVADALEGVGIR
jgi:hypothetical protein